MSPSRGEETRVHCRLLRFTLGIEESRAYWAQVDPGAQAEVPTAVQRAAQAFEEHWFGVKSQARNETIVASLCARYDAYPEALAVLHRWRAMDPETRRAICHFHLQLADPMYRAFSGRFLVERRGGPRQEVDRDVVVGWVEASQPGRWTTSTRIQWASKLLTSAYEAGLVASNRDPRPLQYPKVTDQALTYVLYLLRELTFEGTLTENPYLASVGLSGSFLDERLRALRGVSYGRMGTLSDFTWEHPDLRAWGEATL